MHFPKEVLEHPLVKQFIETYELANGIKSYDLWNRARCETLAIGKEAKQEVYEQLRAEDFAWYDDKYHGPNVDIDSDDVVLIYGDEYPGLIYSLSDIMRDAANELGLSYGHDSYN